ncbi:MAG: OmpA family protein [Candidatus Acidiferrales bacterium]|jgi:outer membrane protein OmpA-like peptidoglycan-associated protein
MKSADRIALLFLAGLLITAPAFAGDDTKAPHTDDAAAATSANTDSKTKAAAPAATTDKDAAAKAASDSTAPPDATSTPSATPVPALAPVTTTLIDPNAGAPAPMPKGAVTSGSFQEAQAYNASIKWNPMPALDGNPGLFTLELGDILPKHAWDVGVGVNKFSEMPGDITQLQVIPSFGVGITNWLQGFFTIDAHDHIHVDEPSLLSLSPLNAANPQYLNTIYPSIIPSTGFPPAYVEDAPFASHNGGGVGEIDLGFKIGLLSEKRGKPLSLSIRNDFFIPTKTGLNSLLANEVQYGRFNYGIGVEASKTILGNSLEITGNWSYRFTRKSTYDVAFPGGTSTQILNLADQMQVGAGMIVFPRKRFQIMTEYDGMIYINKGIQNTTFGARDPVQSITGVRIYFYKHAAIDIGYRYALNLNNHVDRNGFVVKLAAANWHDMPLPPDNVTSSCSADKSSVMEGSGDAVVVSATGTSANGFPLTYMWSANGGKISGAGPYVRWDSTGAAAGNYAITARVDNGKGVATSCSANVTVQPKPVPPAPTMACAADRSTVVAGERPNITASVNDPSGLPLTYSWQSNGGQIVGTGATVQLDTSGLAPGTYTVTGRAENSAHSACDCTANVNVTAPAPPPTASKVASCAFKPGSSRADNVCQRSLDDVAVRLQSDPKAKAVVVGYADPKEAHADKLATARADACKKYLDDKKGVDASRVETRTAAGQTGADDNRRTDVVIVPDGATF